MLKPTVVMLLIFFTVLSASGQTDNTKQADDQKTSAKQSKTASANSNTGQTDQINLLSDHPNAPVIEFDKMVHDYGILAQHSDGNCTFKFINTGREPLILTNVRSS